MRSKPEYELSKAVSTYLKLQYPDVIFRFDMAGLNLSKAQAGMNKVIQRGTGYPDLFIAEPRDGHHGLFIELKKEGTKLYNKNYQYKSEHLIAQAEMIEALKAKGYWAAFGVGFDDCKYLIDAYLGE